MNITETINRHAGYALSAQGLTPAATAARALRGRVHTGLPAWMEPKSALTQVVCAFTSIVDQPRLDSPREVTV